MIFSKWKDYMQSAKVEIFYLDFVESHYMPSDELKTLTKKKRKLIDKSVVEWSHPPVETIIIEHQKALVAATPFKTFESSDPNRKMIEQNNYTNQSLITIGKQIDTIETKVDMLSPPVADSRPRPKIEKPIVQFQELRSSPILKVNSTMKKIEEMLEQLTPAKPEKGDKSGIKTLDSFAASQSESESVSSETSDISKIENAFKNLEVQTKPRVKRIEKHISPTSLTKNWYPRPTPPDIQFEERNFQTQFSVSSDKLYEWNIDGLSEQEILNKLQHMSMVANSYITNHSFRQSEIVPLLVTSFTGTLRYWWDKHLTLESKNQIIYAVKLNEDGLPIFDEQIGQGIEDGVNTLFYTIIEHFIGTPSNTTARIHDQLSNLRCQKLSDFRWYKDVFISRIMLRDDSNQPFWKEKFINGLPNLFAHKIRTTLSNEQGQIDWDNLTYGNIISTINQITEEDKNKLIQVLELRDSEMSDVESLISSSESEFSQSSDSQPSSPRVQFGCTDKCCNRLNSVLVLTKQEEQEELLIDLIGRVQNPELKSEYLKKLKKVLSQDSQSSLSSTPQPISINTTLEKFNRRKDVTLHDLQSEVKQVKKEIVELKQISQQLQTENYTIKQDLFDLKQETCKPNNHSESPHQSGDEPSEEQVAVKPLTRLGLKASILLCLRDARFTEFSDSTLGVIESSLCNGPVHFDCYPDFTVSLSDPHILRTLTLNIKTEGYNVLPGTQPLALVYRIYYKVTGTNMNFQALNKSPKDQTVLIQSHTSDAHIQVPHTIKWSEVALPKDWTLVTESQPALIQRSLNNLDYIQQYLDGTVKIKFNSHPLLKSNVQLQQLPTPSQSQRHDPAQHSFAASSSTLERDLELEKAMIDFKLESLRKTSQVTQPCYGTVPVRDDKSESPKSPTQSDFVVDNQLSPHGRARIKEIPQLTMWLGNQLSNWGTNSQPVRIVDTLKTCTPENSPTGADYRQGCPGFQHFQVSQVSISKFQIL
ncbi:hypothetical protein L3X38_027167 [Prunus dulcis]|uniref:DUF7746 domain-containing protein n=1 Tax=Prunus dulcis TaxID=3755 RepID=A0AAD4Z015_PRUDU|nr:hypothetical protein L3X38_027167 [Prunus dulcis]